jgi:ABC-type nitrate/sulfonate/bicarbonate transport system ATPase subunit
LTHNIDEAVFLADRIVVLSPGPGEIIKTFNIELDRIRDRTTPKFPGLKKDITRLLEND